MRQPFCKTCKHEPLSIKLNVFMKIILKILLCTDTASVSVQYRKFGFESHLIINGENCCCSFNLIHVITTIVASYAICNGYIDLVPFLTDQSDRSYYWQLYHLYQSGFILTFAMVRENLQSVASS